MTAEYEFDWVISNPPYTEKDVIIELGKSTVLVLPIESLVGIKRQASYRKTKLNIFIPENCTRIAICDIISVWDILEVHTLGKKSELRSLANIMASVLFAVVKLMKYII